MAGGGGRREGGERILHRPCRYPEDVAPGSASPRIPTVKKRQARGSSTRVPVFLFFRPVHSFTQSHHSKSATAGIWTMSPPGRECVLGQAVTSKRRPSPDGLPPPRIDAGTGASWLAGRDWRSRSSCFASRTRISDAPDVFGACVCNPFVCVEVGTATDDPMFMGTPFLIVPVAGRRLHPSHTGHPCVCGFLANPDSLIRA